MARHARKVAAKLAADADEASAWIGGAIRTAPPARAPYAAAAPSTPALRVARLPRAAVVRGSTPPSPCAAIAIVAAARAAIHPAVACYLYARVVALHAYLCAAH